MGGWGRGRGPAPREVGAGSKRGAPASPSGLVSFSPSVPITLTLTVAGERSADTATPVTVMNPMRGSRTFPVRKAATVWRISSARRSGRWVGRCFISEEARAGVHDAGAVGALHQPVRLPQDLLGVGPVGAHHSRRQLGALPQVLVVRLRRRDVEALVQPVFETLHDLPFVLQGLARGQVQLPRDEAHDHGSGSFGAAPEIGRAHV